MIVSGLVAAFGMGELYLGPVAIIAFRLVESHASLVDLRGALGFRKSRYLDDMADRG